MKKDWNSVRRMLPKEGSNVQILYVVIDNHHAYNVQSVGTYLGNGYCFETREGIKEASYWRNFVA